MRTLCLVACLSFICANFVAAQDVSVTILVEYVSWSGYEGDEYGPRVRLYKTIPYDDDTPNRITSSCLKFANASAGEAYLNSTYTTTVPINEVFHLFFVSHEERKQGSDDCTSEGISGASFRKPDRYQTWDDEEIDLTSIPPGVYSDVIVFTNIVDNSSFTGHVRVRYTPTAPINPTFSVNPVAPKTYSEGNICGDHPFILSASLDLPNTTGLKYEWQYHVLGDNISSQEYDEYYQCQMNCETGCSECWGSGSTDCYYPCTDCFRVCDWRFEQANLSPNWNVLGESNNLEPFRFIPDEKLPITYGSAKIAFRAIAVSPEGVRSNAGETIGYLDFLPGGPKLPNEPLITASCPNSKSGEIKLTNVSSVGGYRYFLRYGSSYGECNPDQDNCFAGERSGVGTERDFTVEDVKGGTYTLWVTNKGSGTGTCYTLKDVVVPEIKRLNITNDPVGNKNATCYDEDDGEIKLSSTDGAQPYMYSIIGTLADGSVVQQSNATGVFTGLKASTYTASVVDACQQNDEATKTTVQITQPRQTQAAPGVVPVTCNAPANGSISVNVSDGEGLYNYSLSQGGSVLYNQNNTTLTNWSNESLSAGTYIVEVRDANRLNCPGYSTSIELVAPPLLTLSALNITKDSVRCNGGDDGRITLTGVDVTGQYKYVLVRASDQDSRTETTNPVFDKLIKGDYSISVQRNAQCNDNFTYPQPISVLAPTEILASVTKKDISCFGETDGILTSSITGGTGSTYKLMLQYEAAGHWTDKGEFTNSINGLIDGRYRVKAKDKKQCEAVSAVATIIEPEMVAITNVVTNDIKCIGEKGTINITSTGGTGTHTMEYLNSNVFTAFLNTTPLPSGTYQVRVKDSNGCIAPFNEPQVITDPPSVISFTSTMSDFNGFNISCYGGSNAFIALTASGGNGASYAGYQYTVDARPFQSEPKLEGINAGTHSIKVQDSRGCVLSKDILFTQTQAKLISTLVEKQNIKCFGDESGVFEVIGSGGLQPFQYSLNGSSIKSSGRFTNLAGGDYTITLTDKNNCSADFIESITPINPPMVIALTPTDVSCFEGSDGKIISDVSGGVSPFRYEWSGLTAQTPFVSGIKKGNYVVKIVDAAGCSREALTTVNQPDNKIELSLLTTPVCVGSPDGRILATAKGGTPPYQYSKDGVQYQENSLFNGILVGDYTIKAKDNNGCLTSAATTVIQRTDKPEPDFLAATKRNALDTLILREISRPKPDSVSWMFDAKAELINDDKTAPLILVKETGTYSISMTGYFAGCDYTITQTLYINPFDPKGIQEKKPGYRSIESVIITPNPSTGEFELNITLNKKLNLSMIVYDMIGVTHYNDHWENVDAVKEKITLNNISAGVYLIRIITELDARDERIIINK